MFPAITKNGRETMAASRHSARAIITALFGLLTMVAPQAMAAENAPSVHTTEGPIQGFVRNGVSTFLGIPYAAPPSGANRWQPPQPVATWTQTLKATAFGKT